MKVKKYLVSLATEVDGHAQAEAYILNVELGKNAKEEILKKIFVMMDYEIDYTDGQTVYGTFDDHGVTRFSLSYQNVGNVDSQYSTGSRTDF